MAMHRKWITSNAPAGRLPTCPEEIPARRRVLQMALALGAVSLSGAVPLALAQDAAVPRTRGPMPTPDQILGPFYPVRKPIDGGTDLTRLKGKSGPASGELIYVMGRVINMKGEPVAGAQLEVWQANGAGRYTHPSDWNSAPLDPNFEGYATVTADSEGRYRFKTIKPGAYPVGGNWVRPPHIHFDVKGQVVHGRPVEAGFMLLAVAYGLTYIAVLLIGAVTIFSRRDFK